MPSREIHEIFDEMFIGKKMSKVHKIIDSPSVFLGKRHRIFFHDPLSAMIIGGLVGGRDGIVSAILHLMADNMGDRAVLLATLYKLLKSSGLIE